MTKQEQILATQKAIKEGATHVFVGTADVIRGQVLFIRGSECRTANQTEWAFSGSRLCSTDVPIQNYLKQLEAENEVK